MRVVFSHFLSVAVLHEGYRKKLSSWTIHFFADACRFCSLSLGCGSTRGLCTHTYRVACTIHTYCQPWSCMRSAILRKAIWYDLNASLVVLSVPELGLHSDAVDMGFCVTEHLWYMRGGVSGLFRPRSSVICRYGTFHNFSWSHGCVPATAALIMRAFKLTLFPTPSSSRGNQAIVHAMHNLLNSFISYSGELMRLSLRKVPCFEACAGHTWDSFSKLMDTFRPKQIGGQPFAMVAPSGLSGDHTTAVFCAECSRGEFLHLSHSVSEDNCKGSNGKIFYSN